MTCRGWFSHHVRPEDLNLEHQTSQQTHLPQRSLTSLLTVLFPPYSSELLQ